MNLTWYIARSAGMVSWVMLTASVTWGILLSTRFLQDRHRPGWLTDLHRFLGAASVAFTLLHVVALLLDDYVDFGIIDVLVPFASEWRPAAVAWGVVGFWILLAVEGTSLLLRRLSRKAWRAVHLSSFALFWVASFHAAAAGTDVAAGWYRGIAVSLTLVTVFMMTYRVLVGSRRGRRRPPLSASSAVPDVRSR